MPDLPSDLGPDEPARWEVFGERTVYDNPWVRLVLVDVQPPDGDRFEHHVMRLQRVVLALCLRRNATEVLMLRCHRFVTDQVGWELPGGIVDGDEHPVTTAARETEEETGYRPTGPGRRLVEFQPMIGMVDTPHEVWAFDGVEHVGQAPDAAEAGVAQWVPIGQVLPMIDRGEVLGSGSIIGLLRLLIDSPVRASVDVVVAEVAAA